MNLLTGNCPEIIEIDGVNYPINYDHQTAILFELAINDSELSNEEKVRVALNLHYKTIPENIEEAIRGVLWFHSMGKSEEPIEEDLDGEVSEGEQNSTKRNKEIYSLEYDSEYIFSSFLTAYNIDLCDKQLHWWKFNALFNTLPEDTIMRKIMSIRATEINSKMSKEEKKRIKELKKIYALPISEIIEDEDGSIFGDALGGLF